MEPNSIPLHPEELLRHTAWLRALAARLAAQPADADDLAQETILAALEARPRTDRSLRPWLRRVLRDRLAWRRRGAANRSAREHATAAVETVASSAERCVRAEAQRRLLGEVLAFDETYRSVLLLRYYGGLEPAEIAAREGLPAGTVRARLSRAVGLLRERLGGSEPRERIDWRTALLPFGGGKFASGSATVPLTTLFAMKIVLPTAAVLLLLAGFLWGPFDSGDPLEPRGSEPLAVLVGSLPLDPGAATPASAPLEPATEENAIAARTVVEVPERLAPLPLRGVLQTTEGHAVPDFLLVLRNADGRLEEVRTDFDGSFRTAEAYPGGEYGFLLVDHPELSGSTFMNDIAIEGSGPRPTYLPFSWDGESPLTPRIPNRFTARLRLFGASDLLEGIGEVELLRESRARPNTLGGHFHMRAPLRRDDAGAWVRFAPLTPSLRGAERFWLYVLSADGLWSAEARIPTAEGVLSEPVSLTLEPKAAVEWSVSWSCGPDGTDAPPQLTGRLRRPGTDALQALVREDLLPGSCRWVAQGLEPGEWELLLRAKGCEDMVEILELRAAKVSKEHTHLELPADLHEFEVRFHVASAPRPGHVAVAAVERAGDGRRHAGRLPEWAERAGGWTASQTLRELPAGEYELQLYLSKPNVLWRDLPRRITVPGDPVDVFCEEGGEVRSLALRLVDAVTGEPLDPHAVTEVPRVDLLLDGHRGYQAIPVNDLFRWYDVRPLHAARWSVDLEGYEPCEGDWSIGEYEGDLFVRKVRLRASERF